LELSESVKRVSVKMVAVTDAAKQNQAGYRSLIQTQKSLQDQLKTLHIEMETDREKTKKQSLDMLQKLKTAQEDFITDARTNHETIINLIKEFHDWHQKKLESIAQQHESMVRRQDELTKKHEELINQIQGIVYDIPSKNIFYVGIVLFIVHMIITGIIAYGILYR